MKKIYFFLLVCFSTILTSCFEITENIYLEKNGTGKYELINDLGGLYSNPFMKAALDAQLAEDSTMSMSQMEMDTVISFADIIKEADPQNMTKEEKEVMSKLQMNMIMSQQNSVFKMNIFFNFEDIKEVNIVQNNLEKLSNDDEENADAGAAFSALFSALSTGNATYTMNKRTFTRVDAQRKNQNEDLSAEDKEMMELFLGESNYTTIYHFPKRVKKSNIPNSVIDGKTVTVKNKLLDMLNGNVKTDGTIKLKRR